MRIGLINQLHGRPDGPTPPPSWETVSQRALTAEAVGFDTFVFEDALMYRSDEATDGVWESMSIAAALAATTSRINLGQSVVNSPYRAPALTAKMAETIDEISGGRYILGIGAGNTPDSDYEAFGFPTDRRYSRFAEAIQIIHGLLKNGSTDFEGEYYSARQPALVLRGPRPQGPPISIAAGAPKMLQLVARYGDGWNWWGWDETTEQIKERLTPIIETLERACATEQRDAGSLDRSFDLYTVVPEAFRDSIGVADGPKLENPITGTSEQIADYIRTLGGFGFHEVRCDLWPKTTAAIESMAPVVEMVHTD